MQHIRVAIIVEKQDLTNVGKNVEKSEPLCALLVGMSNGVAAVANSMVAPEIIEQTTVSLSSSTLGIYPRESKAGTQIGTRHPRSQQRCS